MYVEMWEEGQDPSEEHRIAPKRLSLDRRIRNWLLDRLGPETRLIVETHAQTQISRCRPGAGYNAIWRARAPLHRLGRGARTRRDPNPPYPGGKKCFENIRLSFLPGVKIGVVGVNGAGKSTLMRIMAGLDKDFTGEAWAAEGARVGYLPQEPELDEAWTCAATSCWASRPRRPSSTASTRSR